MEFPKARAIAADYTVVIPVASAAVIVVQSIYMPQQLFQTTSLENATIVELALPPMLDSGEFDELNESLLALVTGKPEGNWVLDLSKLSYAGSAALGLMVNVRQRVLDAGGSLVLCGLSPRLLQIFRTCCMERLFTIRANRTEALRAVGA